MGSHISDAFLCCFFFKKFLEKIGRIITILKVTHFTFVQIPIWQPFPAERVNKTSTQSSKLLFMNFNWSDARFRREVYENKNNYNFWIIHSSNKNLPLLFRKLFANFLFVPFCQMHLCASINWTAKEIHLYSWHNDSKNGCALPSKRHRE